MSMHHIDGFDWTTANTDGSKKWDGVYNSAPGAIGSGAYGLGRSVQLFTTTKTFTTTFVGGFQGFHVFIPSFSAAIICQWMDAGTTQVELRLDASGHLLFTRNGTTIGTGGNGAGVSTQTLTLGAFNWIEAKVVVDGSAGEASVRVGPAGTVYLTQTGLNTKNTANAWFNQVKMSPTGTLLFDNYHFWDTVDTGDGITSWYGEHIIETDVATADGSNVAFTPNSGSNGFSRLNETSPDGDTTYVSSAVAGNISSYLVGNLLITSGNVDAIAINTIDRVDNVAPFTLQHYLKSPATSGTAATGAAFAPTGTYMNHQTIFAGPSADPNGNIAFLIASRNAAEFGFKQAT
jgi:hypothetical protein